MVRQFQASADCVQALRLLGITCNGPAAQCFLQLITEVLDEDVEEVTALLPKSGLAHPLCPQFTGPREHGDEHAAHVF